MEINYKHKKTKDEAYKILDDFLDELQEQYKDSVQDYSKKWNDSKEVMDFSISARGFSISGKMRLYEDLVAIQADLPFLIRFYENQMESMIKKKLKGLFQ
jgi:hypothetical protein